MKQFLVILSFVFSLSSFAHEGGHGHVAEGGKFGGIMSPMVDKKEEGKGDKAHTLYKAELVRADGNRIQGRAMPVRTP